MRPHNPHPQGFELLPPFTGPEDWLLPTYQVNCGRTKKAPQGVLKNKEKVDSEKWVNCVNPQANFLRNPNKMPPHPHDLLS
jgi:hypothetical protein